MTITINELIAELNALVRMTEAEAAIARSRTVQARDDASSKHARARLRELIPEIAPPAHDTDASLAALREETELQMIARVLAECGGDRTLAAQRLGIGRTTLWRKIARSQTPRAATTRKR